jgi:hypothetical protein
MGKEHTHTPARAPPSAPPARHRLKQSIIIKTTLRGAAILRTSRGFESIAMN